MPDFEATRERGVASPASFEQELSHRGRRAVWVHTRGELDLAYAQQFSELLEEALADALLVVVDLRDLTYIDSTGVHALIQADSLARKNNRRLVIVRGPRQINRLFDLIGLADRLDITDVPPMLESRPSQHANGSG